jgi:hypothetical protein
MGGEADNRKCWWLLGLGAFWPRVRVLHGCCKVLHLVASMLHCVALCCIGVLPVLRGRYL